MACRSLERRKAVAPAEQPNEAAETAGAAETTSTAASDGADKAQRSGGAFTPKKRCPTPKRNQVERERGLVRRVQAPLTAKEARQRRKELKASMSKEELKAVKARERAQRREQRRIADERMAAASDPRYLLPRVNAPA